ncbi:bZIP transcription factor 17-like protein [Tanacetum coccineum]|uniref:BZIP transcription factor 17-like protein n=1 Tax=Tanacetum coccineum TaxID=301880 RepID=A0ABQ5GBH6_9ASTR
MTSVADPSLIFPNDNIPLLDDLPYYDEDFILDDFLNSAINYDIESNDFVSDPNTVANSSQNCPDVDGYLNFSSPEENWSPELGNSGGERFPVSSQGSVSKVSSPESGTNSVVDQKVKCELGVLKRKNETTDVNSESRTNKYRKSEENSISEEKGDEKDEKKKARLIRNRESAQLSRQRKKHYVEELEDKVRLMHSTIQDLNARITFFAAENATLKQQMCANGANVVYPPVMGPMGYNPWMHCPPPPYVMKSQGSNVPLVPIPRLKPQTKKVDVKKKTKTKKVASISFLGLLLFVLLFGGLVPIMNVRFGGRDVNTGYKLYERKETGRVLMGDEVVNGTKYGKGIGSERNASEPLIASLYVPRNDKLVKIDGNLIIHSVLASEKAMASREEEGMTKKAVALDLVPAIRSGGRQPHMYRTSTDRQRVLSSDKENLKSKHADGKLQQWFREGLAGPMLTSGMCTEVFQFDVSAAAASGAIVPATSVGNITAENGHNSSYITTVKNRRVLHGLPIPLSGSTTNITKEQVSGHDSEHKDHHKNNSVSSMVVSVLFDPREAGDAADVEGMIGGKSFSRIFVVVLLDSVKYVTYSCMLPLKGASHLVTA